MRVARSLLQLPWAVPLMLALALMPIRLQADAAPSAASLQSFRTIEWEASGAWASVALPDDWGRRGVARPGRGRYRLSFTLAEPARPWALWSSRFPMHHKVWLNGHLVSDTLDAPDANQPSTKPLSVPLPVLALQRGLNELVIEELGGPRSGLGELLLGEAPEVASTAMWYQRRWIDLPRFLNGLTSGTALFALLLWLWRRSEMGLAWYGVFALVLSLRNFFVLEPGTTTPAGGSLLMVLMVIGFTAFLGQFAVATAAPGRWRLHVALAVLPLTLLLAVLALRGDAVQLDHLRDLSYPLLTLNALAALALIVWRARRMQRRSLAMLALAVGVVVGSGTLDFLLHSGRLPQHWVFCMPWTTPLLALSYCAILGRRLVRALSESERAHEVLEQRVRERTAALEAANATKTRFLAAASHDLRQPMVTIGVLVGVLREQPAPPAQQRLIARVNDAVVAMEGLLAGLLDLSRLDSGGVRAAREVVPLAPLLGAVAAHAREAAREQGLRLRLRVPPQAAVLGDALLVEQILRNLVGNALRYTDSGGVLIGVRRCASGWRLGVWDTGRGIAPEHQQRVFEEFVQLDNPQRDRQQGLGLGLAIVRRAAGLLGAEVSLRSRPGRGSCFSFMLPACTLAVPPPEPTASRPPPSAWLRGRRVALVEDDSGVRAALVELLSAWGATAVAMDSAGAVQAALGEGTLGQVDLLLTDMRLPGGSGLQVVAMLREHHPGLPAVVVTGNTAPEELAELAASGLPVVHKPFRAEALAAAIDSAVAAGEPQP